MTNLEKLIETLQEAPIEKTACFINYNVFFECNYCAFRDTKTGECTVDFDRDEYTDIFYHFCEQDIKQWLESEVKV